MVIYVSRAALLERMPVLDEATYYSAKQVEVGVDANQTGKSEPHSNGHAKQPNGVAKHLAPETALIDLLSFLPDEQPSAPHQSSDDALLGSLGANVVTSSGEFFLLSCGQAIAHIWKLIYMWALGVVLFCSHVSLQLVLLCYLGFA
jgi:hypothetical protein